MNQCQELSGKGIKACYLDYQRQGGVSYNSENESDCGDDPDIEGTLKSDVDKKKHLARHVQHYLFAPRVTSLHQRNTAHKENEEYSRCHCKR